MHEAGIAQEVISICAAHLSAHGGRRATAVGLRIGALASVDPESLTFAFDCLKRGTPFESATLTIDWRSRFGCACPSRALALDDQPGVCPVCGAAESFANATALDVRYLEFDCDEGA